MASLSPPLLLGGRGVHARWQRLAAVSSLRKARCSTGFGGKGMAKLKRIRSKSYTLYLRSDLWRDFKKRYKAAGHRMQCLVCDEGRIQLHHHTYERLGREEFG